MNFEEIKKSVWNNKETIFLLIIIFLLAISIRSNLVRFEGNYLFEPDAYYHARLTQELITQGYVGEIDPNVYYFVEGGMPQSTAELQHYLMAALYFVLSLGFYNKELIAFAVQIAPILFGAIISVGMYFLAKEIFNSKKVGLVTGFLAAIGPAFAYRTMAGAEGNDSLAFVWMVIGFVFLIRAIKTKSLDKNDLINTSLSGIFFGLMAITWRANILIPLILIPSSIFMMMYISGTSKKEKITKSEPFNFITKIFVSLGIYTIISTAYSFFSIGYTEVWFLSLTRSISNVTKINLEITLLIGIITTIVFIGLCFFFYNSKKEIKSLAPTITIILLYVGLIAMLMFFAIEPDFFYSGEGRQSISSLVGEESLGNKSFGIKYNSLIVLPIIALFVFPITLYFFKREDSHTQILLWFWTIITLFMAWYKLKFTFIFGLGLIAGAAITCYIIFELLKKYEMNKALEGKIVLGAFVFILLTGVSGSDMYLTQFAPFANSSPYWIETMDWIQNNTDENAKFFNWWSDGHQLAFVTERKFSVDNRNASGFGNKAYAEFTITNDVQRGYDIVTKEIGAEYIILPSDNFYSGPTFEFYYNDSVDSSLGNKYYDFSTRVINCYPVQNGMNCNEQIIPTEQYEGMGSIWKKNPSDFYNGETPIYYYAEANQLIILGQTYNNTNLAKVYFNSEETKDFYEEVYSYNGMKIFKVK
ncbi:MAG: STT3 domain-containing protein [Candidatus ainarchaeum sp.]|nr:STT3 domain-containing protein [Candidatus ainarchaeum sp.]